jgi:hypothetical protein
MRRKIHPGAKRPEVLKEGWRVLETRWVALAYTLRMYTRSQRDQRPGRDVDENST